MLTISLRASGLVGYMRRQAGGIVRPGPGDQTTTVAPSVPFSEAPGKPGSEQTRVQAIETAVEQQRPAVARVHC